MAISRVTDEQLAVIFGEIDSGAISASEASRRYEIPRRTLMRRLAERRSNPAGEPQTKRAEKKTAAPSPPMVVVVSGDALKNARLGLENGIKYLASVSQVLDATIVDPTTIRVVGTSIVQVLAGVIEVLERAKPKKNAIATLSDEQLIARAKEIAAQESEGATIN